MSFCLKKIDVILFKNPMSFCIKKGIASSYLLAMTNGIRSVGWISEAHPPKKTTVILRAVAESSNSLEIYFVCYSRDSCILETSVINYYLITLSNDDWRRDSDGGEILKL